MPTAHLLPEQLPCALLALQVTIGSLGCIPLTLTLPQRPAWHARLVCTASTSPAGSCFQKVGTMSNRPAHALLAVVSHSSCRDTHPMRPSRTMRSEHSHQPTGLLCAASQQGKVSGDQRSNLRRPCSCASRLPGGRATGAPSLPRPQSAPGLPARELRELCCCWRLRGRPGDCFRPSAACAASSTFSVCMRRASACRVAVAA